VDEFDDVVDIWATALAAKSPLLTRLGQDAMDKVQDLGFKWKGR
jgi:hypothetical protein